MGTQLRDPINSGLTRRRLTVYADAVAKSGRIPVSKYQLQFEFGEGAGLRGTRRPNLSRETNSQARRGAGKY